jgi:hypothetical protein
MAQFRVNQRVRIVRADHFKRFIGLAATIVRPSPISDQFGLGEVWWLDVDGHGEATGEACHTFQAYKLAPLEDPKADEFIERIKKLKPYDEPLVRDPAPEWDVA